MDKTGEGVSVTRIRNFSAWISAAAAMAAWLLFMSEPVAAQTGQPVRAGDMEIFYGLIPAEIVLGRPADHAERGMHGGAPAWGEQFHLIVSVLDQSSGKRISDAEIKATVYDIRSASKRVAGARKRLEPMLFSGAENYGNYFNMPGPASYRIDLEIRRPDMAQAIRLPIAYRHALVPGKPSR